MRLFSPPYQVLVWAALLLLGASFIKPGLSADIHFLDTYYVMTLATLLRSMALGCFVLWLLYLVNRPYFFSDKMIRIHVIVTLVTLAGVLVTTLWINDMQKKLLPTRQDLWTAYYRWEQVQRIAITLVAAAQVVFLMNLLMGVKRAFRKR